MKARMLICLLIFAAYLPTKPAMAEEVNEGGVTIRAGRIMNGAKSHRRFYGYNGVEFVFIQPTGGTLSFLLWNDQDRNRLSVLNYLNVVIKDQKFLLESYSTPFDLKEFGSTFGFL